VLGFFLHREAYRMRLSTFQPHALRSVRRWCYSTGRATSGSLTPFGSFCRSRTLRY